MTGFPIALNRGVEVKRSAGCSSLSFTALALPAVLLLQGCSDDSTISPMDENPMGTVAFELDSQRVEELWSAFYGDVLLEDPTLLLALAQHFQGATSIDAIREACLSALEGLEIRFRQGDSTVASLPVEDHFSFSVDLPPGEYTLALDIPLEAIQSPFVFTYDEDHPGGYLKPIDLDSIHYERGDILGIRVLNIQVKAGEVTNLSTLDLPEIGDLLGGGGAEGGSVLPQGSASEASAAVTFRPSTFVEWIVLANFCGASGTGVSRIDADSDGKLFAAGGCDHLYRLDSSPLEVEDARDIDETSSDIAVKAHGSYVYVRHDHVESKLFRHRKDDLRDEEGSIDLDKWNYSFGWVRKWTVSTDGFLFARDFEGDLVIADLGEGSAMKFGEFEFRDLTGEPYDLAAVQEEYNYAFVAGERKGGSEHPGIYKISKDGNLIRTFGHSENHISRRGSLAVDRERNVYVVREGGTNEGYFGSAAQAITVYDKYGEFLGYIDLGPIQNRLGSGFWIEDIAVDLDDNLFVLISGMEPPLFKFRLEL